MVQKKKKKKFQRALYRRCNFIFTTKFLCYKIYIPVSILYKSIAGRYRHARVADGPITARYRFIKNASWEVPNFEETSIGK